MESSGAAATSGVVEGAATAPVLPAYGHAPFKGTFHLKLDAAGRVALPAGLKAPFAGTAVLRAHRGEFLNLWTPLAFDQFVKAFGASQPTGVVDPRTRKRLHMSSSDVAVDKQHRFVIPPELRTRVGLTDRIVLAGSIETIEIWPADTFDAEEETFDDVDLFIDGFEGL